MASTGVMKDVTPFLLTLLVVVSLGPFQFGYHLAELNAPEDVITCRKKNISSTATTAALQTLHGRLSTASPPTAHAAAPADLPDCLPMSKAAFATVAAVFTVGGLIGALAAGPLCSARGRKPAMQLAAVAFVVGSLVETAAGSVPLLGLGRVLTGLGAGASTVIVPLYISEVAPPASRGFFGFFTQIGVNVGIVTTQALGYLLSYGSAWRWILGAGVLVAVVNGVGLFLVTESPAWLACHKGDFAQAKRVLQRIRGHEVNLDTEVAAWGPGASDAVAAAAAVAAEEEQGLLSPTAEATVMSPRSATDPGKGGQQTVGFFQVVRDPFYRPAIICVIGIMFAQQMCGINSVILYSVSLLDGMLPINSALLTVCVSLVNLATTIAATPLPDRLGRKACLVLSIIGQGSSSLALALSIMFGIKVLSAISVVLFVAFFGLGLGPVPFIMASELVGQEAVGSTQSWALAANYVATFLVAQFFPIVNTALNERLGGAGWVYFFFAAFAVGFAVFVSVYVPETKGKKDADEVWGRTRRID